MNTFWKAAMGVLPGVILAGLAIWAFGLAFPKLKAQAAKLVPSIY